MHPLKSFRADHGVTQQELAARIGLSRWTVNQIETGAYGPSWKMCLKIEGALGIPRHELRPDIFPSPEAAQ